MTDSPPDLEWDDIQGNILRGYGFDHARHLVLRITSPVAAREWLGEIMPTITPATPWGVAPEATTNVAFTHRGLAALGVDTEVLTLLPRAFRDGMRARALRHLGDVGPDDPSQWETGGVHDPTAHVLLMVHSAHAAPCAEEAARLRREADGCGLELLATETLANLPFRTEHFGFHDGVSQPAVEGAIAPSVVPGNGTPLRDGTWRPLRAGEFVVGYPDEEEDEPPLPGPAELVHNGSFLVYRKLAQDVAAFRRFLQAESERHGITPELLGAKLVGRQTDGAPVGETAVHNDFRFDGDKQGLVCPIGSHIRRANPRDGFGFSPELVSRHRLLRRGMPYGAPLREDATVDDGTPRGLLFVAYCAHISRQYEVLQREWLNDGNMAGLGHTTDPLTGHGSAPRRFVCHVPGRRPLFLTDVPRFVRPVGGEYLLQPGLRALRYLAEV